MTPTDPDATAPLPDHLRALLDALEVAQAALREIANLRIEVGAPTDAANRALALRMIAIARRALDGPEGDAT
jgi:hypothetical protein